MPNQDPKIGDTNGMTHGDACDANSVVPGEGSVQPKQTDEIYHGDEM